MSRVSVLEKRRRGKSKSRKTSTQPEMAVTREALEVFNQDNFVARLVVNQLIDQLLREHQAQPAGAKPLLFADCHVRHWIIGRITYSRMLQVLHLEPGPRIIQAIHQEF